MFSVQLGSALSVELIETVGPAGTAWLRLTMGTLILGILVRPRLRGFNRADLRVLLGLGVAIGLVMMTFLSAIERIPLGTAAAIEFLGPLTLAAARSHSRRALIWPLLAGIGVILLTEPWRGEIDPLGVAFALMAAACWAAYILFNQQAGDRFAGVDGLALALPVAAVVAAPLGIVQAVGHLDGRVLLVAAGIAVLVPVLPFALELLALRHMTTSAFGTFMALEPAISILLGLIILSQEPGPMQYAGIVLVVLAGAAAQRGGRRGPAAGLDVIS